MPQRARSSALGFNGKFHTNQAMRALTQQTTLAAMRCPSSRQGRTGLQVFLPPLTQQHHQCMVRICCLAASCLSSLIGTRYIEFFRLPPHRSALIEPGMVHEVPAQSRAGLSTMRALITKGTMTAQATAMHSRQYSDATNFWSVVLVRSSSDHYLASSA